MPLLDHFRPPVKGQLSRRTLHLGWLATLSVRLNRLLPPGFIARESMTVGGRFEVDIGTYERDDPDPARPSNGSADGIAVAPAVYTPPPVTGSFTPVFHDVFEILVYDSDVAGNLVAAVELVSPANKDRPASRGAFVAKCASYLGAGASLVILDAVTDRRANLHNELAQLLDFPPGLELPSAPPLYAAAYRPVFRGEKPFIDVWAAGFAVGDPLPTMPLRLTADLFVPVEFEETYTATCRDRRLIA